MPLGLHRVDTLNPRARLGGVSIGYGDHSAHATAIEWRLNRLGLTCTPEPGTAGDLKDDDCDGEVDEELANLLDDDGDSRVDEDLARGQEFPPSPPIASSCALTTEEDHPVAFTLPAIDLNGDPILFDVTSPPQHGTLIPVSVGPATPAPFGSLTGLPPTLVYRPADEFFGNDQLSFVARDPSGPSGVSAEQTVQILARKAEDAPTITSAPPTTSVLEGVLFAYAVTATDSDPNETLTYSLPVAPPGTIDAAGHLSLQTSNAVVGPQLITVVVTDSTGLTDAQSFTLRVIDVNAAPRFIHTPTPSTPGAGRALRDPNFGNGRRSRRSRFRAILAGPSSDGQPYRHRDR